MSSTIPSIDDVQNNVQSGISEYDYWLVQAQVEAKQQQVLIKEMAAKPDPGVGLWFGICNVMTHSTDWCGALLACSAGQMDIQGGLSSGIQACQSSLNLGEDITDQQCDNYAAIMQYIYNTIGGTGSIPDWMPDSTEKTLVQAMNDIATGYMQTVNDFLQHLGGTQLTPTNGTTWTPADMSRYVTAPGQSNPESVIKIAQTSWSKGANDPQNSSDIQNQNFGLVTQSFGQISTTLNGWNSAVSATSNFYSDTENSFTNTTNSMATSQNSLIQSMIRGQKSFTPNKE